MLGPPCARPRSNPGLGRECAGSLYPAVAHGKPGKAFLAFHRALYAHWEGPILDEGQGVALPGVGLPYWNVLDPQLATTSVAMIPELAATGCPPRSLLDVLRELAASPEEADAVLGFIGEEGFVGEVDYDRLLARAMALHDLARCWMIAAGYAPTFLGPTPTQIQVGAAETVALQKCDAWDWGCAEEVQFVNDGLADSTALSSLPRPLRPPIGSSRPVCLPV